MIEEAKKFVADMHLQPSKEQRYGGKPYTFHTDMVAGNAWKYIHYIEEENRENVIISAHGHDLIEDTEVNQKMLVKKFNSVIADTIFRVTNERGFDHIEVLFKTLPKIRQSHLAIYVKLCDRMANGFNSKNENTEKGKRMYKKYRIEYPIFRYALRNVDENGVVEFEDMWKELDDIFNWKDC